MTQIDDIRKAFFMKGQNISEIAREFQKDRKTIRKYIYQEDWNASVKAEEVKHTFPKLNPFKADIDQWLEEDKKARKKQRHTAKRIYDRLCEKYQGQFNCSYRTVAGYVALRKKELYQDNSCRLPLEHIPGEAQVDFGEADFYENGTLYHGFYLNLSFPFSNVGYTQLFKGENQECLFQGLKDIFEHIGGVPHKLWFDNASTIVKLLKNGERKLTDAFHAELFNEDRKALLKLPTAPYEVADYITVKTNAYAKFSLNGGKHIYSIAPKYANSRVLVKITAHEVIPLDESHREIVRHRRLYGDNKQESMDWLPYLAQLSRCPGALKYSGIYSMLPDPLREYLDGCSKSERGKALKALAELCAKSSFEQAVNAVTEALLYGVLDLDSLVAIHNSVDWDKRDREVLAKAKAVVEEKLNSTEKPERITVSLVGSKLGLRGLLEKHFHKMLLTKQYIDSVKESRRDFQLRRIKWAVKELEKEGQEPKLWKVLRKAGIRKEFCKDMENYITKIIIKNNSMREVMTDARTL